MTTYIGLNRDATKLEAKGLNIANEALVRSSPGKVLPSYLKRVSDESILVGDELIDLTKKRLFVIGWGKASSSMAVAVEEIIGINMIHKGAIISNLPKSKKLKKIITLPGDHPLPSHDNVNSTLQLIKMMSKCREDDVVMCLISGGGSALLSAPVPEISLESKRKTIDVLLKHGVEDEEMNIIRKHLSLVKGGKLAKLIYPARVINFIISDDPANMLSAIASGPTVGDPTTFSDASKVLSTYKLEKTIPMSVSSYLNVNAGNSINETITPRSKIFDKTKSYIISDNRNFRELAKEVAQRMGVKNSYIHNHEYARDIEVSVSDYCNMLEKNISKWEKEEGGIIIAGGEIPIKINNNSKGGRCQHFAAMMIPFMQRYPRSVFMALATDGRDYISGVAGAITTDLTSSLLKKNGVNLDKIINDTDSYKLHDNIKSLILTKIDTGHNVSDIYIFLKEGEQ